MKPIHRHVVAIARVALGALFIYLGAVKAYDPVGFLKLVRQFDVLHAPSSLNFVAAVLPWFEIFCGVFLVVGIKARAAALLQLLLLIGFTVLVALRAAAIYRAGGTPFCSIRFDCGCGTGEVLICFKFVENTALMLLSAMVVVAGGGGATAGKQP